jgi:hypothetical protein
MASEQQPRKTYGVYERPPPPRWRKAAVLIALLLAVVAAFFWMNRADAAAPASAGPPVMELNVAAPSFSTHPNATATIPTHPGRPCR